MKCTLNVRKFNHSLSLSKDKIAAAYYFAQLSEICELRGGAAGGKASGGRVKAPPPPRLVVRQVLDAAMSTFKAHRNDFLVDLSAALRIEVEECRILSVEEEAAAAAAPAPSAASGSYEVSFF